MNTLNLGNKSELSLLDIAKYSYDKAQKLYMTLHKKDEWQIHNPASQMVIQKNAIQFAIGFIQYYSNLYDEIKKEGLGS